VAESEFRVKFWGVRGSLPVSGAEFTQFGGNTISLEISFGGETLLFDAGSGLPPAGRIIGENPPAMLHLFMTHYHYDHIIGLPFFCPLFMRDASVTIWSGNMAGKATTRDMLRKIMHPPLFPVSPDICAARVACRDFRAGDVLEPLDGLTIRTGMLNHPGGAIGYRVEWGGRVVAVITDTEHEPGKLDETVLDLIADADLFIYDGAFEESELAKYKGFGHSTWQQAVLLAKQAGAKRTAIFHHAPTRTDEMLLDMERRAQERLPSIFFARDLQTVDL
jgi:phosphoribosyl 1,2-cyclic phosphodiesterase